MLPPSRLLLAPPKRVLAPLSTVPAPEMDPNQTWNTVHFLITGALTRRCICLVAVVVVVVVVGGGGGECVAAIVGGGSGGKGVFLSYEQKLALKFMLD